ncbi:MAG: hypothetical protein BJ554DRAFT_1510, partial [Olpidium bornovanus]
SAGAPPAVPSAFSPTPLAGFAVISPSCRRSVRGRRPPGFAAQLLGAAEQGRPQGGAGGCEPASGVSALRAAVPLRSIAAETRTFAAGTLGTTGPRRGETVATATAAITSVGSRVIGSADAFCGPRGVRPAGREVFVLFGRQEFHDVDSMMTKHHAGPRLFVYGYPRIPNEGGDWRTHGPWRDLKDAFPDARVFMNPLTCNAAVTFACEDDLLDALKHRRRWSYAERETLYEIHTTEKPRALGLLTLRGTFPRHAIKELKAKLRIPDLPWAHICTKAAAPTPVAGFKEDEVLIYFNEGAGPEYAEAKKMRSVEIDGYVYDVKVFLDPRPDAPVPVHANNTGDPSVRLACSQLFEFPEGNGPRIAPLLVEAAARKEAFVRSLACRRVGVAAAFLAGLAAVRACPSARPVGRVALASRAYKRRSSAQMRELAARIDAIRGERDEAEAAKCRLERKLKLFEELYREEQLEKQFYRNHVRDAKLALAGLLESLPTSGKDDKRAEYKNPEVCQRQQKPQQQQQQQPQQQHLQQHLQQQQPPPPPQQQQQQQQQLPERQQEDEEGGAVPEAAPEDNAAAATSE